MIDLNDAVVFVKVAELGSFSKAAKVLGMPVSTASRKVKNLEDSLGVILIQRSTRQLTLTAFGRSYLDECRAPLQTLAEAEAALKSAGDTPEGILRITAPVALGQTPFYDFISRYMLEYPRVRIDLSITNTFVDLIGENIDLAIRFGELQNSTLIARRLGTNVRYLVATPTYLASRAAPESPSDLISHDCIVLNGRNMEVDWDLVRGKERMQIPVQGKLSSRDFQSISAFAHNGNGIALLPTNYCQASISDGRLVRVLPDWSSAQIPVHAVYPTRKFTPLRTTAFVRMLQDWQSPLWLP